MSRRRGLLLAAYGLVLSSVGCVNQTQNGDATTAIYDTQTVLIALFTSIAMIGIGIFLRNHSAAFGYSILGLGGSLMAYFVPMLMFDRVMVDPSGLEVDNCVMFYTTKQKLPFAEMEKIEFAAILYRGRRGGSRTVRVLDFYMRDGRTVTVAISPLVDPLIDSILHYAQGAGVTIEEDIQEEETDGESEESWNFFGGEEEAPTTTSDTSEEETGGLFGDDSQMEGQEQEEENWNLTP